MSEETSETEEEVKEESRGQKLLHMALAYVSDSKGKVLTPPEKY